MDDMPEDQSRPTASTPALSIVAIVLSIGALFVSVLEVSAIRDEQKLQAWPYVEVSHSYNSEGYSILTSNKGIGPARIRSVTLSLDGEVDNDLDSLVLKTVGEEDAFSYDLYRASDIARSVMSPEEQAILFAVPWQPRTRRLSEIWSQDLDISICYCSVYDECWESTLKGREPEPAARCNTDR